MAIEQYFQTSPMDWFRENQDSRYSPFHWNEIKLQTLEACAAVQERCQRLPNPVVGIIGFGFGRETELLFDQGITAKVIGLDINRSRFEETRIIRPDLFTDQLYPVTASMNNTPFADNAFDAVLCLETMMHSDNPNRTLNELTRITKPDGIIVFNLSTSLGTVNNLLGMLSIEGLPRVIGRLRERMLRDKDSSSARTRLYTPNHVDNLIRNNSQTQLERRKSYLRGLSTYIVLKKSIGTNND